MYHVIMAGGVGSRFWPLSNQENPKQFLNLISSQRLLRRLDEVYLLDSSGNIIMSNKIDVTQGTEAYYSNRYGWTLRKVSN